MTVYRNPQRSAGTAMNLSYLGGYALITEQRTVDLPAGEVDLRFEGVAGGIIPQSAIVTGLSDNVLEKNRDAALLSPSALLNAYLGRRVSIRRTNPETGKVSEFEADVRTDASGGMVVQTANGFEALQCTGLNEAIIYPQLPEGLSAKPTLSVKIRVAKATRAIVTLSYLATGFDWQANYVADISDDGQAMNLFSWVTLANADETSFTNAQTQTVAGQPNKGRDKIAPVTGGNIRLACWPEGTTSDIIAKYERDRSMNRLSAPPPPPAPPMAMMEMAAMDSAGDARKVMAQQEDLGDLKLYRIPVPVTVASKSQKQVAFLEKEAIPFTQIYEAEIYLSSNRDSTQLATTLRFRNDKQNQLGIPLPAGKLVAFRQGQGERLMVGKGSLEDKAVGEQVEVTIGISPLVRYSVNMLESKMKGDRQIRDMELTVTNASRQVAAVELKLLADDGAIRNPSRKLGRKDGVAAWKISVAAGGKETLRYRIQN